MTLIPMSYVPTPPPEVPLPTPSVTSTLTNLATTGGTLEVLPYWVAAGFIALGALMIYAGRARRHAGRASNG